MWSSVKTGIADFLVSFLGPVLNPWHDFLNSLPPWSWKLLVCAWIASGVLWALFIPRQSIYAGAPSPGRWRDLRLWLVLLLVPYLLVYILL